MMDGIVVSGEDILTLPHDGTERGAGIPTRGHTLTFVAAALMIDVHGEGERGPSERAQCADHILCYARLVHDPERRTLQATRATIDIK